MTRTISATAVLEPKPVLPSIFDSLPLGIIQTDAAARPFALNRYAARILRARDGLTLTARGLKAEQPGCTTRLHEAVRRAAALHRSRRSTTLILARPSGRRPFVVVVVSAARSDVHRHRDCASSLFIADSEARPFCDQAVLRRWFGLTAAEARLAAGLVSGMRIEVVARLLGITAGTARVHLKRIFDKTDSARQAELVALLVRSPAMLRPPRPRQLFRKTPISATRHVYGWWLLDYIPLAVIAADPDGRVRSVNEHGRRILSDSEGLGFHRHRLYGANEAATAAIHEAIARASDAVCPQASALLLSRHHHRPLHLMVVPHSAEANVTGPSNGALLIIDDPHARPPFALEVLIRLFQLTPAEARLSAELAIGTSLKAAAGTLAISIDTARTHLKRIFGKTGTGRQAELVALLAASSARLAVPGEDGSTEAPEAATRIPNGGRGLGEVWLTSP